MSSLFRFVIFIILTYFVIIVVVNAQRAQRTRLRLCSIVNVPNALVRFKHNYKIMRINCVTGFNLQGSNIVGCENGKWNAETPVCTKEGCPRPETPPNGLVMPTRYKANLYCTENYKLVGGRITYCNGTHWDRPLGSCQETSDKIQLTCDFESDDLCGWSHDETHNFDWKRVMAANLFQQLRTGPQHDHTTFTANSGHYMLMESFDQLPHTVARFISPIYSKTLTKTYGCFRFFYFMYGAAVGSLNVYVKPVSVDIEQMLQEPSYKHFGISGNQKNIWKEGLFIIKQSMEDFQIVVEGTAGINHLSDIAIDDVQLMQYSECAALAATGITKSPEFTDYAIFDVQSCEGRCSETNSSNFGITNKEGVFYKSCDCHEECETLNTCCPNYRSICEFANNAEQTTTELLESATFLPSILESSLQTTIITSSSPVTQTKTTPTTTSATTTTTTTASTFPVVKEESKNETMLPTVNDDFDISEVKIAITTLPSATQITTEVITDLPKIFPVEIRTTLQPTMMIENNTKLLETTSDEPMTSFDTQTATRLNVTEYSEMIEVIELNPTTDNILLLRKDKFITWQVPRNKPMKENISNSSSPVLNFTLIVITISIVVLAIKHHKQIQKFKQRHFNLFLKENNEDSTVLIYNQNNELL